MPCPIPGTLIKSQVVRTLETFYSPERGGKQLHWPRGSGPFYQFEGGGFSRCWVTCWHGPGLLGLRPPPLTVSGPPAHRERIIEIGRSPLYLFDLWKTPPIAILLNGSQAQSGTIRNAHILSPLDVKRKKNNQGVVGEGGCWWWGVVRQWSSLGQRCRSNSSVAILAQAIRCSASHPSQPLEICGTPGQQIGGTPGQPKTAYSTVSGTPATDFRQDIRVPDGGKAAAADAEVDKECLGQGKEEEAGKEKRKEEDRLPVRERERKRERGGVEENGSEISGLTRTTQRRFSSSSASKTQRNGSSIQAGRGEVSGTRRPSCKPHKECPRRSERMHMTVQRL